MLQVTQQSQKKKGPLSKRFLTQLESLLIQSLTYASIVHLFNSPLLCPFVIKTAHDGWMDGHNYNSFSTCLLLHHAEKRRWGRRNADKTRRISNKKKNN